MRNLQMEKRKISREKLLARAEKMQREDALPHGEPIWSESKCLLLRKSIQEKSNDHAFQMDLEEIGGAVARQSAYVVMTGQSIDASPLRDGWRLQMLAGRFYEREFLRIKESCRTLEEVGKKKSLSANHYWSFSQVVWGQFSVDLDVEWREGLSQLKLCEIRGQFDLPAHFSGLPRALNTLLRMDIPSLGEFGLFDDVAPLKNLGHAWNSDESFRKLLIDACDWHLEETFPADSYHSGYALFPTWLFALDRYRQKHTGISCLPDHPLMVYGERILSADFSGPAHPLVAEAEAEYARRYGDNLVDLEGDWLAFLELRN